MDQERKKDIIIVDSKGLKPRLLLGIVIVLTLLFGWFSIRWQLSNMLAELTSPNEPNALAIAGLASDFSSGSPMALWLLVKTKAEDSVSIANGDTGPADYERLVRLSPNNFTWWIELGRSLEQAGQPDNAEKAFVRAVGLAPAYTRAHWQLGNFYLRQNRDQEAFAELQKAAEHNSTYREQVFSIVWDFYENDTARLEEIAGESPAVRAGLAKFYAVKERPADSLRMWNTLTADEKNSNQKVARLIAQGLFERRFYRQALEFVRDLGIEPKAEFEKIQNGDFEEPIGEADYTYFNWSVAKAERISIKLDPTQARNGQRSLRFSFNSFPGGLFYNLYQIVPVEPGGRYELSFWVRSDGLKSGGLPVLEIVNAADDKIIATSKTFPSGSADWTEFVLDFDAPADSEAVQLRTTRTYCGEACPIIGTFWYDDFRLDKLN